MGEYYAVYQSGAELLGVGLTIADALQAAELWSDRSSPPSRPTGWTARAGKRAEPIISAPVPRNSMRPCMLGVGISRMRSTMRAISRCSTRTRPDPYPDWGKLGKEMSALQKRACTTDKHAIASLRLAFQALWSDNTSASNLSQEPQGGQRGAYDGLEAL
jgi:hypothetical protein